MSDITTIETWVRLPTPLGADDLARADQPGSSGLFQVVGSNATLACRENGLYTAWERGPLEIWSDCLQSDNPATLRWSATEGDGVLAQFCGRIRVRLYGETQQAPRITFAVRGAAPMGFTLGIILLVQPTFGPPDVNIPTQAVARTTSTSATRLEATVALDPSSLGRRNLVPVSETAPTVEESGAFTELAVFVGAWCTSDSSGSKAPLGGMTVYLTEPA